MKTHAISLILFAAFTFNALAQEYSQWGLPDGALRRIGKGEITEIKYSPDGGLLAVASSIGIWLYDAVTYQEIALVAEETGWVESVALSPVANVIASGSRNGKIHLWDSITGEFLHNFTAHSDSISGLAFSPDGSTLASGSGHSDHTVRLWNPKTGEHLHSFTGHSFGIESLAFSPDGSTLASGGGHSDHTVRLWNPKTGEHLHTLTGHTREVTGVAFSPDSGTIASGSRDRTVRVWNAKTGEHLRTLTDHPGQVVSIAFNPIDDTIAVIATGSSSEIVRLWNSKTGTHTGSFNGNPGAVRSVAYSPDGSAIASGCGDGSVCVWDTETGEFNHTLTGHTRNVLSVAYSPDGSAIAIGSRQRIYLRNAKTGENLHRLPGHRLWVNSLAYSPDGRILASGGSDAKVHLWDAMTGEQLRTLGDYGEAITSVAFSLNGETLAVGSDDGTICLWNPKTGRLRHRLTWHVKQVNSVVFSPNGRIVASASNDGTIAIFDVDSGELQRTLTEHDREVVDIAFSPNGRSFASATAWGAILWDAVTWSRMHTPTGNQNEKSNIEFSPNGRMVVRGSTDRSIRIWDAMTGEALRPFTGHASFVNCVAISPDGRALASGSHDGTVLLWELVSAPVVDSTVSITPAHSASPEVGELLTISLTITAGENVAGYEASLHFDSTVFRYVEGTAGDYLAVGSFFVPPVLDVNRVTLGATSLDGASSGDGTLAALTFEVLTAKSSNLILSDVSLAAPNAQRTLPRLVHGKVMGVMGVPTLIGDVNSDGAVNILDLVQVAANFTKTGENDADVNGDGVVDILDLVIVAGAIGGGGAAPSAYSPELSIISAADVERWLAGAQGLGVGDTNFQRGVRFLEQLLAALTPEETALLPNYPNPFNPETWIPYRLAREAEVAITIYNTKGTQVRRLALGNQAAGYYAAHGKAAYWDGRNESGEYVASGVYFYQLRAGDYAASRRMVIVK